MLSKIPLWQLNGARLQTHQAVQLVSRTARALLTPEPDDSHSSMQWNDGFGGFLSRNLVQSQPEFRVGLRMNDLAITVVRDREVSDFLLMHGKDDDQIEGWIVSRLLHHGLRGASLASQLPYSLETAPSLLVKPYDAHSTENGRIGLQQWFSLASSVLEEMKDSLSDMSLVPSPVVCWPHHYDIATLVALESDGPELARSVGMGMSPGDGSYPHPYFYVNPWPMPSDPSNHPAPSPGHWHTEGFVSIVLEASALVALAKPWSVAQKFLTHAFRLASEIAGV